MARGRVSGSAMTAILANLGAEVSESAKKALLDGANVVLADAKSRISNVTGKSTGKLAASGHLEPNKKGTVIKIVFDAENDGYQYGRINEFRPGHEHPFLYPALDAHRDEIRQNILDAIHEAVQKLAVT